jgi:membrane protease YdiL (CAAX protease family)
MASVLLSLSLLSPAFLPGIFVTDNRVGLLLLGVVSGLVGGGFLEELGWTGFAVPHLRARYDVFRTGLIVGVLWGAWHLLIIFWMSGAASQGVPLAVFLTVRGCDLLAGQLPAFRILMVWVYDQTGSLLVVMLMHASLSASMLILQPIAITGIPFLTYCVGVSVTMWVAVAVVAAVNRGKITRTAFMA